jgi:hypothetical protein
VGLAGVEQPDSRDGAREPNLTDDERGVIQQVLEQMVRERAGARGAAKLTNIGVGTK